MPIVVAYCFRYDNDEVDYYEEFPSRLLPSLPQHTRRPVNDVIVVVLQYGHDFLKAHTDVFRTNRATAFANRAHRSNFLHPVLYYYKTLPTGETREGDA